MSNATIRRIPIYYQGLKRLENAGVKRVKSKELAEYLDIDHSTIRRDFSKFGELGKQGYGYNVDYLLEIFYKELGIKKVQAVLFGVGSLGQALLKYNFIDEFGLEIVKAYDLNPKIIGKNFNGVIVEKFTGECSMCFDATIAIVAVETKMAKNIVDTISSCSIKGILNFTGERFSNNNIIIHNVDLSSELLKLIYDVQRLMEVEK